MNSLTNEDQYDTTYMNIIKLVFSIISLQMAPKELDLNLQRGCIYKGVNEKAFILNNFLNRTTKLN